MSATRSATRARISHPAARRPILRWTFTRHTHTVVCGVDMTDRDSYDVSVGTPAAPRPALVEHFDAQGSALLRHAEMARRLRESGWVLTRYGDVDASRRRLRPTRSRPGRRCAAVQ